MKATVYLNLNLDNPKDIKLYHFLNELGREKKSVLYYLLNKQGCFNEDSEGNVIRDTLDKKKQKPLEKSRSIPTNTKVKNNKVVESIIQEESVEKTPLDVRVKENIGPPDINKIPKKESWEKYFSTEQITKIKDIPHVYEGILSLTEYQQQVMAEELNGECDDYALKGALEEAKFAHE